MVIKQLFDKVDVLMLVQQHISHIFHTYFKLDRSAYFGKISAINWHACIMPKITTNDTFFVILAHNVPEIFYFMVFKIVAAAILSIGL